MNRKFVLALGLLFCVAGCKQTSNEQKMMATTDKVIAALQTDNENDFEKLIGVELLTIGKDKDMVNLDFKKIKKFYDRFLAGKRAKVFITDEYRPSGHRKVVIPFSDSYDSAYKTTFVQLELYYGPPNFVPLSKLSDYELVAKYDQQQAPPIVAPGAKK